MSYPGVFKCNYGGLVPRIVQILNNSASYKLVIYKE